MLIFQNIETLKDPDIVKQLGNILKTNYRICKAVGQPFGFQVGGLKRSVFWWNFMIILKIWL